MISTKTKMKKQLTTLLCTTAIAVSAQTRIGDFIESQSYNESLRGSARQINYWPEKDALVCHNGTNRFTRALYGGPTEFRLETSDRPVFATYKKRKCRNISLDVKVSGKTYKLDEVDDCTSTYDAGRRCYVISDSHWLPGASLNIVTLAEYEREAAIWKIEATGFDDDVDLTVTMSEIAQPKLNRSGDIGADRPGCFEAVKNVAPIGTLNISLRIGEPTYFTYDLETDAIKESASATFDKTEKHRAELASTIQFETPEDWINVLDGTLAAAADGIWDGETWLHGAIGWRMPLAGWRAAYVGDILGWTDRAESHFDAYASSQVTNVEPIKPHPTQDPAQNGARALKEWGTQMYSNGYICRNPNRNDQMHHYDMNLNYIDELLWHLSFDSRETELRKYWPVIKRHIEWEKRNFDPDDDGLYDAYCCIWASDALYYSGGGVTHSTAYNIRALRLAAKIAAKLGEDPSEYQAMAEKSQLALDERLWVGAEPHWAEYQDLLGLHRVHQDAALWTTYTAIDCAVGTAEQRQSATRWVDSHIPHIPVVCTGETHGLTTVSDTLYTVSTSDWMPYSWSINNVACAEVLNMALACFEAGRPDEGYRLMKANALDNMFMGSCPGNFGQISFYDAARGECYRDFGDVIGVASRTLIQGLFGIVPDALDGRCTIRPGFPADWERASIRTPYLSYEFHREGDLCIIDVEQNFKQPLTIGIVMLSAVGEVMVTGTDAKRQTIKVNCPRRTTERAMYNTKQVAPQGTDMKIDQRRSYKPVDLSKYFNDSVSNIFKHKYLNLRPAYTTLQIPEQGIGEWCHPKLTAEISDSAFRAAPQGEIEIAGLKFATPAKGNNVAFTSLWDNFPDEIVIPIRGKSRAAMLLLAGSTNHMQSHIANGEIVATYADGTTSTLELTPPYNWCPIEQDYYSDGLAFRAPAPRPLRVGLKNGEVGTILTKQKNEVYGREIDGGAATMLRLDLDAKKSLRSITIRTLSNDVVIGLLGLSLEQ